MNPVANMDELHRRAAKSMQVEELREFKSQERTEENTSIKNDRDRNPQRSREGPRGPRVLKYTPLNTGRARILEEALSANLIFAPLKFPSPSWVDQSMLVSSQPRP